MNNEATPRTAAISFDEGNGLTTDSSQPGATQEMYVNRAQVDQASVGAIGYTRYEFDRPTEDSSQVDRWISVMLTGFQSQDQVSVFSVDVDGAQQAQ